MFFDRQIRQKFLIYAVKKHLTYEICQRKFGCVKGAFISYGNHTRFEIQAAGKVDKNLSTV